MAKTGKKYYAVRTGRQPGIYLTWDECKAQVDGYAKAEFKGFSSLGEAEAYLGYVKSSDPPVAARLPGIPKTTRKTARQEPEVPATDLSEATDGLKRVVIYTDGACIGNPGPGGYGVVLLDGEHRKELSGGFRLTTNNRMEMLACIVGLRTLNDPCVVTLYSDSRYVINSMTKGWARRWKKNDWERKDWRNPEAEPEEVPNADLWEQLLELCDRHKVRFNWVRGHAGNTENEHCDQLAGAAAMGFDLAVDSVYEKKP